MAKRPIFYDTETTGIRTDKDRIVEIAAYDPLNKTSFAMLVNPGCPIPPEATSVHHISDTMVADQPSFAEVATAFVEFCAGDIVLIAHNNDSFDLPMLKNEFTRHSVAFPEWQFFDSLKWARRYRPDLPRHSLQFLRETYGFAANNAHRALDDVIILHQVFNQMVDDLSIEEVLTLMNKPRDIQHMPWGKYQGQPLQLIPPDYVKWLAGSGAFDKPENSELKSALQKLGLYK